MNAPDHIFESLETIFWVKILKFFDADPDPGSENLIDPGSGMKKFGSGINIPDPQHCILVGIFVTAAKTKEKISKS
jgi:hypothetical protein